MTAATVGYRVGLLSEIPPGEGRAFAVGAEQVAVFHLRTGAVRAVSAVCPHAGGPVADGQTDSAVVVCPLHLNSFDLATGRSATGAPPIAVYQVEVDPDGWVVIHLPGSHPG